MADDQATNPDPSEQPKLPKPSDGMAAYKRAWRARRKASGVCTTCGGARDIAGAVRCLKCRAAEAEKYGDAAKARRRLNAAKDSATAKAERLAWKLAGLCTFCGDVRDDAPGLHCKRCAHRGRAANAKKRAERVAAGLCPACGAPSEGGSRCAACLTREREGYHSRQTDKRQSAEFQCADCNLTKPRGEFPRRNKGRCYECHRAASKAGGRLRRAEWREANREKCRASSRNAQRVRRSADPEAAREKDRKWRRENPDAARAKIHRYAMRVRQNGGEFSAEEWAEVKRRQNYRCPRCGRAEPEIKLTVDHVIPVSKGGRNDASNLQALCGRCNSSKHTKHVDYRTT